MAEAESHSITRRSMVAGSAVVPAAVFAGCLPGGAEAAVAGLEQNESRGAPVPAGPIPHFAGAQSGLRTEAAADPVHAAIAAHARAYAAYEAQLKADAGDDVAVEPLCEGEREAADALAATVPATLEGAAAALSYVRLLHERDDYPLLDDFGCYVLIASAETALRRALDRSAAEHAEYA